MLREGQGLTQNIILDSFCLFLCYILFYAHILLVFSFIAGGFNKVLNVIFVFLIVIAHLEPYVRSDNRWPQ